MDPIRPIGPVERDLEPIMRVARLSKDAQQGRRERQEEPPRPRKRVPPRPPEEDEGGPSLIDVKV